MNAIPKKKLHKQSLLGKCLSHVPAIPLFYPVYLAGQLDIVPTTLRSSRWPKDMHGFTAAFASDIHYGPYLNDARLERLSETLGQLGCDMILLGGDFGESEETSVTCIQKLHGLYAPHGVYAVPGNHDRLCLSGKPVNTQRLRDACRSSGITLLENKSIPLGSSSPGIMLYGTDDFYSGRACDLHLFPQQHGPYRILLTHTPDILIAWPAILNSFDLCLCGHTHGGQVQLFHKAVISSCIYKNRFLSGTYHEGNCDILVSNGVGTSSLPVRFGARPQIHVIRFETC